MLSILYIALGIVFGVGGLVLLVALSLAAHIAVTWLLSRKERPWM